MSNHITWIRIAKMAETAIHQINDNMEIFAKLTQDSKKQSTLSKLIYRIFRNLIGVHAMIKPSVNHGESVLLKLPVGIILRNCLMDSIIAIYISLHDEDSCNNFLSLTNRNYINALLEEYEVYRDKIPEHIEGYMGKNMFTMAVEDRYLDELSYNSNYEMTPQGNPLEMWRATPYKQLYEGCKRADGDLKALKDKVLEIDNKNSLVESLYAYYKYFSQYEHFSQRGDGDSRANFGDDNICFEKTFQHLQHAVDALISTLNTKNT